MIEQDTVLIKELTHRIKNSLQTVSSIMRLQASVVTDPIGKTALQEASLRVLVIGRVHEDIYDSAQVSITSKYIERLLSDLQMVFPVHLEEDITPVRLDIDLAVPLALILHEAVVNAVKYDKLEPSHVRVKFGPAGPDMWALEVANGAGFLKAFEVDFANQRIKELGMRLIQALAIQLRADVTFSMRAGGVVCLSGPTRVS